jgi:hypothetical protein
MKVGRLAALFAFGMLATSGAAFAQGSGGVRPAGGAAPQDVAGVRGNASSTAFVANDDMKGKITAIDAAANFVTVEDKKGKAFTFKIAGESKLKADKWSELGEKKKLALSDFQVGQKVKVVYRESDSMAMELKLLAK